jgi:hypothetical protein
LKEINQCWRELYLLIKQLEVISPQSIPHNRSRTIDPALLVHRPETIVADFFQPHNALIDNFNGAIERMYKAGYYNSILRLITYAQGLGLQYSNFSY